MATLAPGGRIGVESVEAEIDRLNRNWGASTRVLNRDREVLQGVLSDERLESLDRFDLVQLAEVIRVCRQCKTLSAAGRELFAVSRKSKRQPNDADRLRKYLQRFSLSWDDIENARSS